MTKFKIDNEYLGKILKAVENNKTPFYLYFSDILKNTCETFNNIPYQNKSVHFATMANANPTFLKILKEKNINVFVNSIEHLKIAMDCGYTGKEIIFTSSAMNEQIIRTVKKYDIMVNLDSLSQVKRWTSLFPDAPFGIRYNIGNTVKPYETRAGYFIGKESRLGINEDEIKTLFGNKLINGIHLYAGTDIMDVDYLINCYKEVLRIADKYPNLEYLDFGGGFAIEDIDVHKEFDMETYSERLTELLTSFSKKTGNNIKVILEPGRIIGGKSAYFVCKVTDVKVRYGIRLVGVDASSTQFPRPLFYPDSAVHPIFVNTKNDKDKTVISSVYGCSTYSRDFLARNTELPIVEEGNIIIFGNAGSGSYCASSYTSFLGFEKPNEIFI